MRNMLNQKGNLHLRVVRSSQYEEFAEQSEQGVDEHGQAQDARLPRARKRRRVIEDEEGEAEEGDETTKDSVEEARSPNESSNGNVMPQRLVLLTVKTSSCTDVKFAVFEDIIWHIAEYAKKLQSAISRTTECKRLCISDTKIRKEETILQVIEFLTNGTLAHLDSSRPKARFDTLLDFIHLYELGENLGIASLPLAIVQHIDDHLSLNIDTFIKFAEKCYKTGKISADCYLGQSIKAKLAEHLHVLYGTGVIDEIRAIGGTLSEQLMEVLIEDFAKNRMQKHANSDNRTSVKDKTEHRTSPD